MHQIGRPLGLNKGRRAEQREFLVMLLPAVAVTFLFAYIPMIGIIIGFCDLKPGMSVFQMNWVGLKWFEKLWTDMNFWRAFRNTMRISFMNLIFTFPFPILFALLLGEIKPLGYKRFAQSASYFPYFISTVIVVQLLFNFFGYEDGMINMLLQSQGKERINFFLEAKYFTPFYVGTSIWQTTGWSSVIYLSAITTIDQGLYEAATIDGAGRFKQMLYITLPHLKPTIMMLLILNLGSILSVGYEKVMLLYNPAIYDTADVLSTYIYRTGVINWQLSYSTAMGLFNQVVNFIVLISSNFISRKLTEESLW